MFYSDIAFFSLYLLLLDPIQSINTTETYIFKLLNKKEKARGAVQEHSLAFSCLQLSNSWSFIHLILVLRSYQLFSVFDA